MPKPTHWTALTLAVLGWLLSANLDARTLSLEERVSAQRALEEVFWRQRIWPESNRSPKPALEAVIGDAAIRAKVEDALRKATALESLWGTPITAAQLQAEMERMARSTRQPEVLRELFEALGNDPFLIAECLARPILADRLLRNRYARDERVHRGLKKRAEGALALHPGFEGMKELGGEYRETTWKRAADGEAVGERRPGAAVSLNEQEWTALLRRLGAGLGAAIEDSPVALPLREPGPLHEDDQSFSVLAVLAANDTSVEVATVTWAKTPFDSWWRQVRTGFPDTVSLPATEYSTVAITGASCVDDTWLPAAYGSPDPRQGHTAVWTGTEMIVWGGAPTANTGGRYTPATDLWTPTSTGANVPSPRFAHVAIWTGTHMIVWGGFDLALALTDTGGRYDPLTDSWLPTATLEAPSPRVGHTAVWTGTEMIVWGGYGLTEFLVPLDSGGRYDPTTDQWRSTLRGTRVPTPRAGHTAVWTGSRMLVWGGHGGGIGPLHSGGVYDPATNHWTPTSLQGAPVPRERHTAVWTGNEMVVWGGSGEPTPHLRILLDTGGRYDPSANTWKPTSTGANLPASRADHTAVWTGGEMIVWGGVDTTGTALESGARYDPIMDTWIATSTGANVPSGRQLHSAVWTGTEMIVWGGPIAQGNTGGRYDPWADTWRPTSTGNNVPSARGGPSAVWTGSEMIVWGGFFGSAPGFVNNDGGRYSPTTDSWTPTSISTNVPSGRSYHTAVWTGREMIVWGGRTFPSGYDGLNTGGRYDPAMDTWTPTAVGPNVPLARSAHTAVWTGGEMIVWGGVDTTPTALESGARYDPIMDTWIATSTGANLPSRRADHSAIWTGSEMIVWGGCSPLGGCPASTGGRYDPLTDSWLMTSTGANVPTGRRSHTSVWTGNEMIVWGGSDNTNTLNSGARYDPVTDTWIATSVGANIPSARGGHSAIWTGSEMIVWGGVEPVSIGILNTGGRYSPSTDTWTPTSVGNNVPTRRFLHSAVWTGSEMIVWGGQSLTNGGRYCAVSP